MELSEEEKIDELTLILNSGDNETIIDNLLEYIHKKEAKIEELKLYIEELKLDLEEMTKSNNHKQENWVHKNILNSYISKVKIREKIKNIEDIYKKEMKPYQTEYGLNLSLLSKKEKEEVINKRNGLLTQKITLEELLEGNENE